MNIFVNMTVILLNTYTGINPVLPHAILPLTLQQVKLEISVLSLVLLEIICIGTMIVSQLAQVLSQQLQLPERTSVNTTVLMLNIYFGMEVVRQAAQLCILPIQLS